MTITMWYDYRNKTFWVELNTKEYFLNVTYNTL